MPLSEQFITALLDGHLSNLQNFLQNDLSLSPEIRVNTLTVYYRGGSLIKVEEITGTYQASFNAQYAAAAAEPWAHWWVANLDGLPEFLNTPEDVEQLLMRIPFLKSVMDRFYSNMAWREREAQQRIVLENNRDGALANSTDYCFCDMEVVENQGAAGVLRADLIGVEWPAPNRGNGFNRPLVVAEVKYGDGALGNLVADHYQDLHILMNDHFRLEDLKARMLSAFQQKHRLGYIRTQHQLEGFSDTHVIWLLILINHNPRGELLRRQLVMLDQFLAENADNRIQARVATSNFMGYGLWTHSILGLECFLRIYDRQIGP